MHKAFYLTFSICFIFLSNLQGSNKDSIDLFLQKQFQAGKLNGNVLIVKNGTTVYENSFGFTDGTRKEPLSKQHKFIIGSIYKEFPAVTILQLVELEQLKLSDKLNEHLLDLPSWANEITITHFLQYSSGLPKVNWNKYFSNNIMLTEELLYEDIQQIDSLAFTPGSDYLYSNMGPILLTKVVESVTGIPFKGYVQKHILDRYGLFGIKFKEQYPYKYPSLMAIPFNTDSQADSYNIAVPGLLITASAEGLQKWFQLMSDFRIISKESVFFLSQKAIEGNNIQAPLGRCDWDDGKIVEHFHHGSSGNYECVARRFAKEDITIVILTNQKHGNVTAISERLYQMVK